MFTEPEYTYDFVIDYTPVYKLNVLVSPALSIILGLKESFLVSVLYNLCEYAKKIKNAAFFQEGEWWCRASCEELSKHYPYLGTHEEIRQLIKNIDDGGYLFENSHSFPKIDNTKWVSLFSHLLNEEIAAFYKKQSVA